MVDIMDRLDCFITKEPAFQFNKDDIKRMRAELYNLLGSITHLFWNHRRVTEHGNLSSDDDSDDSDVEIIDDPMGDDSTNTSGSRWSYESDFASDEDEELVFEHSGKSTTYFASCFLEFPFSGTCVPVQLPTIKRFFARSHTTSSSTITHHTSPNNTYHFYR
jgi:hypothetical protein